MPVPEPTVNAPQEYFQAKWESEKQPNEGDFYWVVLGDNYASDEISHEDDQKDYVTVAWFLDGEFIDMATGENLDNVIQYAPLPPLDPAQIYRIRYRSKRAREREN